MDRATRYATRIAAGEGVAGKLVRAACVRHLQDLETARHRGLHWVPEASDRVADFFHKYCRHSKGEWAGKPVELADWQAFHLGSVFGWRRDDGTRRFRTAYNAVARKNGKSTSAAGFGLYMLLADNEPGAEVYSVATKKDQARIVFDEAKRMVLKSPALNERIKVFTSNLSIEGTASKFEPLASDEDSLDGLNPHAAIVDELHAHKTRAVFDVIESAFGARRQGMLNVITTRGVVFPSSICVELDDYSQKVLEGTIQDDAFFGFIACLDDGDEWDDETVWEKANPNLNISVKLDTLREKARKAQHAPGAQTEFRRKNCNLWTEGEERWLDLAAWRLCGDKVDPDELRGRKCWAGLDLSNKRDLTALVLVFPSFDGKYDVLPFIWTPGEGLSERADKDRAPYPRWRDEGILYCSPGPMIDKRWVATQLAQLCSKYDIQTVAYDRWGMDEFRNAMSEVGCRVPLLEWGQGFRDMNAAVEETERLILEGKLRHGMHPVLTWCASNATLLKDPAGNRKLDKSRGAAKIDGVVAMTMAVGAMGRTTIATGTYLAREGSSLVML